MLAAALPSVALAHGDDKTQSDTHSDKSRAAATSASVEGTVQAVTGKDLTVKDNTGRSTKVEIDKTTQFDDSGKTGTATDLRAGMSVTIQGKKMKDGTVKATSVRYDKSAPVDRAG
jgi:hypothetical protein